MHVEGDGGERRGKEQHQGENSREETRQIKKHSSSDNKRWQMIVDVVVTNRTYLHIGSQSKPTESHQKFQCYTNKRIFCFLKLDLNKTLVLDTQHYISLWHQKRDMPVENFGIWIWIFDILLNFWHFPLRSGLSTGFSQAKNSENMKFSWNPFTTVFSSLARVVWHLEIYFSSFAPKKLLMTCPNSQSLIVLWTFS